MRLSQSGKQELLDDLVKQKWLDCEEGFYQLGVRCFSRTPSCHHNARCRFAHLWNWGTRC